MKMTHFRETEIKNMDLSGCGQDTKTIEVPEHLFKEAHRYLKHIKTVAQNDPTFKSAVFELPLNMILDDMDKISRFYGHN